MTQPNQPGGNQGYQQFQGGNQFQQPGQFPGATQSQGAAQFAGNAPQPATTAPVGAFKYELRHVVSLDFSGFGRIFPNPCH